jgi:hypothetical protein
LLSANLTVPIPDIRQGFSSGEHNEDGTGIPHLRPMNIDRRGRIVLKQLKYVAPTTNDLRITRGDVLFNNTNSADLVGKTAVFDLDGQWGFSNHMTRLRPPSGVLPRFIAYQLEGQSPELVGRSAMYRDELPGACFQKTLIRFRAKPGMSPTFALLVFRAYLHTGRFRQASRWSTNIAHLTRERFAAMPFPLPPLAEQERIVVEAERRLDAADAISELVRSIAHRVVSARHVVLREAFSGRLMPSIAPAGAALQLIRRIQEHGTTDDNSKERHFMPRRPSRRKNVRRPLVEVLTELGAPTSPEDLLEQSGIGEDLIDEFFMELRDEIFARRIREDRDLEGNILLVSTLSVA